MQLLFIKSGCTCGCCPTEDAAWCNARTGSGFRRGTSYSGIFAIEERFDDDENEQSEINSDEFEVLGVIMLCWCTAMLRGRGISYDSSCTGDVLVLCGEVTIPLSIEDIAEVAVRIELKFLGQS